MSQTSADLSSARRVVWGDGSATSNLREYQVRPTPQYSTRPHPFFSRPDRRRTWILMGVPKNPNASLRRF